MSITEQDIQKLAELAKLDIHTNNTDFSNKLTDNLNNILKLFEQLHAVDTTNIEPMIHADDNAKQRLRADLVTENNVRDIMQQIAPPNSIDGGLYLVPKVIENN